MGIGERSLGYLDIGHRKGPLEMNTWIAALIGAVIGSIGGQLVASIYDRRRTRIANRRITVSRYLVQLQDAIESLAARASNVSRQGGLAVMKSEYYLESTLFALALFLAQKRRLVTDGAYAQVADFDEGLATELENNLEEVESILGRPVTCTVCGAITVFYSRSQ